METVIASAICIGVCCGFQNCKTIIEEVKKEIVKISEKNEMECESHIKNINNQKTTPDSITTKSTELATDQVAKKNTPRKPPRTFELHANTQSMEKNDNNLQQTLTSNSETSDDYKRSKVYIKYVQYHQTSSEREDRFRDISVQTDRHSNNNDALLTSNNESQKQLVPQISKLRNKELRFPENSTESGDSSRFMDLPKKIDMKKEVEKSANYLLTSTKIRSKSSRLCELRKYLTARLHRLFNKINNK